MQENKLTFADLFAGAGGFTVGFKNAGFLGTKAVEFDPQIANTYSKNNPEIVMFNDDIKKVDQTNDFKRGDCDVIIGGPPCQGFSMAGSRNREGFMGDPRNYLFRHYFNIVKKVKPKAFVFENVKGLLSMEDGKIFNEIQRIFSSRQLLDGDFYDLYYFVAHALDFGIPQKRERVIIIGVLNGKYSKVDFEQIFQKTKREVEHDYPNYFDQVTVYDAIGNLPEPTIDGAVIDPKPETDYESCFYQDGKIFKHTKRHY